MITIGTNNFESYKTTLPVEDREVIIDCDIDTAGALGSQTKIIKTKTFSFSSVFNAFSGNHEISTILIDDFIARKASKMDYIMEFEYVYSSSPTSAFVIYTYTGGGVNQFWKPITRTTNGTETYSISDLNCTGYDYANDSERINIDLARAGFFTLDLTITVKQETPTTIEYTTCADNTLTFESIENEEDTGSIQSIYLAEESELATDKFIRDRKLTKASVDFGKCDTYRADYRALIYSANPSSALDTYYFDTGFTHIQVKLNGSLSFFNTVHAVFDNVGLAQQQIMIILPTGIPTTITSTVDALGVTLGETYTLTLYELILGVPTLIPFNCTAEVTLINQALADTDCPCSCNDGCFDEVITINWRNNCGELVTTQFDAQIRGGVYTSEGDGFKTHTGEEIFPEVRVKNEYTLSISKYSDQVFKALSYLIANNLDIQINGVSYLIPPTVITPTWDTYNRFGSVSLTIIEKDSVGVIKRNCC